MNSVERVKELCKSKKIPISRLEKDLGYANGYIGQLRKGVLPDDRLVDISSYLCVTPEYLIGSGEKENPALVSESGQNKDELELIQAYREAPENVKEVIQILLRQK